jgi:hypothetical protein
MELDQDKKCKYDDRDKICYFVTLAVASAKNVVYS